MQIEEFLLFMLFLAVSIYSIGCLAEKEQRRNDADAQLGEGSSESIKKWRNALIDAQARKDYQK